MHTEKEALTKRCCVTQCGSPAPEFSPAMIQARRGNVPHMCIGSACMGWRWADLLVNGPDSYQSEPGPKGYCGRAGYDIPDDIVERTRKQMRRLVET